MHQDVHRRDKRKKPVRLNGNFLKQLETMLTARSPAVVSARRLLAQVLHLSDEESDAIFNGIINKLNVAYFPPLCEIELVLTEKCNLACTYCFEGHTRRGCMTHDIARRAVDLLLAYSHGVSELSLLLFGGEPFLNFSVLRTATEYAEEQAKAYHKHLRFNCTSNCTILTDEMLEFVAQHRIAVLASVDGLADSHDRYRKNRLGLGTFTRVMRNLDRLKRAQGFLGAKLTVMPANVSRLCDDVRGLYDLGMTTFVIGYPSNIWMIFVASRQGRECSAWLMTVMGVGRVLPRNTAAASVMRSVLWMCTNERSTYSASATE